MNANQRLNPTPPGYNPLPSPCCSEEFSSEPRLWNVPEPPHQTSPLHMRRHTHKDPCAHLRSYLPIDTHIHAVPADQRSHITVFVPEWCLFPVTLVPKSLSKHTFMDTTIILTHPHTYSPCWWAIEDILCRFVECWWAFTPQRVVSCISNNPEPENVSLL